MGFKPRVKPTVRRPAVIAEQPREPIPVAAIGETPRGWQAIHYYIHEFEEVWDGLDPQGRDSFIKAMALFLGGACAESHSKLLALSRAQSLVRAGFVDYPGERNSICQAVVTAHTFERGDHTVN